MSDDRWEEESLQNKLNYDIIYIGDSAIKIPRAFELGAIFGTFPVFAIDAIWQGDGSDLARAVVHTLANTFAFNPIPQGAVYTIEDTGARGTITHRSACRWFLYKGWELESGGEDDHTVQGG